MEAVLEPVVVSEVELRGDDRLLFLRRIGGKLEPDRNFRTACRCDFDRTVSAFGDAVDFPGVTDRPRMTGVVEDRQRFFDGLAGTEMPGLLREIPGFSGDPGEERPVVEFQLCAGQVGFLGGVGIGHYLAAHSVIVLYLSGLDAFYPHRPDTSKASLPRQGDLGQNFVLPLFIENQSYLLISSAVNGKI